MRALLLSCLIILTCSSVSAQATGQNAGSSRPFTVVLDAGHGGHDPGNLGNGYLEKDIALNIVLEVGKQLEKEPNINVIYTRKDDSFVDLYVRGEIANKAKADLFVSVHCDSHTSDAHGAGTFVLGLHANKQNFEIAKKENSVIYLEDNYETRYAEYDINSPESVIGLTIMQEEFLDQSILLGKLMQDRFTGDLNRNDRKVKQAGFIVLHQTFMPSVLVETGFLTNKDEGRYLNSNSGQKHMGEAIAGAIIAYRQSIGTDAGLPQGLPAGDPVATSAPKPSGVGEIPAEDTAAKDKNTEPEAAIQATGQAESPPAAATEMAKTKEAEEEIKTGSEPDVPEVAVSRPGIVFRVQLMAVSKDPDLSPEHFNGLPNLSKEHHNDVYRVLYGKTDSYSEAEKLQSFAALRGYPSAYIVAYRDGERIPVPEALAAQSN